jgi:hypothetical protein
MQAFRCYFLKGGVIRSVEVVRCTTDEAAIEQAMRLYESRKNQFAGIELWDGARLVYQHPADVRKTA